MLYTITKSRSYFKVGAAFLAVSALTFGTFHLWNSRHGFRGSDSGLRPEVITKEQLASALAQPASFYKFPTEMEFRVDWDRIGSVSDPALKKDSVRGIIEYAFDPHLQNELESMFQTFKPDYGAFVAVDAKTGQVLALVSYSAKNPQMGNLAVRATFPSASVFKMVTAAAAIESRKFSANTVIPFNGSNHTLYRSNVMKNQHTRWTRYTTLKDAFAKSINTVFGRIGAFTVEPAELRTYADRFGFNRRIASDIPMQEGRAPVLDDPWKRAETASGYTRENTMSPLQGALMAAAVVNDGKMMEPYVVRSVYTENGSELYSARPKMATQTVDPHTAAEVRALMRETVTHGTSRKSFRNFFRGRFAEMDVGGKTGSLTGDDPQGKYDWFVGYADDGHRKIAISALTIHEKLWRVKSSYLARRAIETYFKRKDAESQLTSR